MLDWTPFVELVRTHRRFFLTTHVRPDGDGLGSMLALGDVLRRRGTQVRPVIATSLPGRYRFLDPEGTIEHWQEPHEIDADLILILDTGTWNQLGAVGPLVRSS